MICKDDLTLLCCVASRAREKEEKVRQAEQRKAARTAKGSSRTSKASSAKQTSSITDFFLPKQVLFSDISVTSDLLHETVAAAAITLMLLM